MAIHMTGSSQEFNGKSQYMLTSRQPPILIIFRPLPKWLLVILIFPLINESLNRLIIMTEIPLFLDSILTAVAAAIFGIWPGILVALLTNSFGELFSGFHGIAIPFAICGIATAVIVGLMAKRGKFVTILQLAFGILAVSLANSLLGAVIATFVFGGQTGVNIDVLVDGLTAALGNIFSAAFLARIPANFVDKGIAVLAAYLASGYVRKRASEALPR
jgi:energy-coupling factor transport system substrate-specific component